MKYILPGDALSLQGPRKQMFVILCLRLLFVSSKKCLTCPQSVITAMIPMAMTLFKKLHFQIIDFVEAFHTQYHTILVTEFLPGEMVMVMVVKGMVNGEW